MMIRFLLIGVVAVLAMDLHGIAQDVRAIRRAVERAVV